jgi:hypothetical protein
MSRFTISVARFVTTPHRVLARGTAAWFYNPPAEPSDAELIPEIPQAMRRDLRLQGLINIVLLSLLLFAFALTNKFTPNSEVALSVSTNNLLLYVIFSGLGVLVFGCETYRWPLSRQLRYRRQHGRWRWER